MIVVDDISRQVRDNCNISDAQHAGLYSICGLALRLRDLYKWEKGLPPWEERDSSQILDWIEAREEIWESVADSDYHPLAVNGRHYDPSDIEGINAVLEPECLFYGAGYAYSLKPTFLLARIDDKKNVNGHTVYNLGQELARDLLTIPALTQDKSIVLRQEAARLFLWDKMFYIKKSGRAALAFALNSCGIKDHRTESLRENLDGIFTAQKETFVYHEIGEMRESVFDRTVWREVITAFPRTPIELLARAIKDLLADTNEFGTLPFIVRERNPAALGLYVAFFDGLAKEIFPELRTSFDAFATTKDWRIIEKAVAIGYATAKEHAEKIVSLFQAGKQKDDMKWTKTEIANQLLCKILKKSGPSE
jgi:hypothetical protein